MLKRSELYQILSILIFIILINSNATLVKASVGQEFEVCEEGEDVKLVKYLISEENILEAQEGKISSAIVLPSVEIPNTITVIGQNAFKDARVKSITIPSSVKKIEPYAFDGCVAIEINIPTSINVIDKGVYKSCSGLSNIKIPNNIINIESQAFAYCTKLESVSISNSVQEIGVAAFSFTNLDSVYIPSSVIKIGSGAFDIDTIIYGEEGSSAEKYAKKWGNKFIDINMKNKTSKETSSIATIKVSIVILIFLSCIVLIIFKSRKRRNMY